MTEPISVDDDDPPIWNSDPNDPLLCKIENCLLLMLDDRFRKWCAAARITNVEAFRRLIVEAVTKRRH